MTSQELTLNIAVNLSRLSRWAMEGRTDRMIKFLNETERYLEQLQISPKNPRFEPTFNRFKESFTKLKSSKTDTKEWAEDALTWANILTHRAKLA